jgi:heavy metal translocating P-type ATPase
MRYLILHESSHTMRVHMAGYRMSMDQADILEYYLKNLSYVTEARVYERTGDAIITYRKKGEYREQLMEALCAFSYQDPDTAALVPEQTGRALNEQYQEKLVMTIAGRYLRRLFLPVPLQIAWTAVRSVRFIWKGLCCLLRGQLQVPVLDAAAILASMLTGDFDTAGSVMWLLDIGDILEEWTHKKSIGDLARSMSLKVDKVWLKAENGQEVLVSVGEVQVGDRISVRTSNVIPLDGVVTEGEMSVNQSSMTGESVPVVKTRGGYVYAGTVVEEGECVIEVTKKAGSGKYDQIVHMIEESEKLKSNTEARAYHLADSLVPYSLGLTAAVYLVTGNVARAMASLMVDFSCALKLSMPLAVLSAIREAGNYNISVKGGKFLEAVAQADTIVFDKTGTLTHAAPAVVAIETFDGAEEQEVLKIAACLEEHFPHSIANAVVNEAKVRGIDHAEMHTEVKYVVAHGIASEISGKRAVIGSYHFVFEDEKCSAAEEERERLESLPAQYSRLYLAIDGRLKAVICIFDPLREEAADVIRLLHAQGFSKICMMTGDNEKTAEAVARQLHLDEFHAEVLPEDKAAFIRKEHEAGRKVVMVGDGVNDTPALSEADAGVAVSDGAAIAREVADITVSAEDLYQIVVLRRLSRELMKRIDHNYRFIIGFNAGLIALGVAGILAPATSALLHNTSTLITGLRSMTNLLPQTQLEDPEKRRIAAGREIEC